MAWTVHRTFMGASADPVALYAGLAGPLLTVDDRHILDNKTTVRLEPVPMRLVP